MRHIKSISELFKSTYISAAKKSYNNYNHYKRGDELIKHGEYRGENKPVDRIFPHRFIFDNIKDHDFRDYVTTKNKEIEVNGENIAIEPPYFSITDFEIIGDKVKNNEVRGDFGWYILVQYSVHINIYFESNYGKKLKLDCYFSIEDEDIKNITKSRKLDFKSMMKIDDKTQFFKFKNRKDAVQFKKFLTDDVIVEFLKDIEEYPTSDNNGIDKKIEVIEQFKNYENGKFYHMNSDGIPSIYIGLLKDIPINSFYENPRF